MHSLAFLQDLAVVLLIAGLVTILFNRLKQPVVLGYILAGFLIGPHTPPASLIHSEETIHTLAELGIILLMFSLGLEFNLRKLREVGMPALVWRRVKGNRCSALGVTLLYPEAGVGSSGL